MQPSMEQLLVCVEERMTLSLVMGNNYLFVITFVLITFYVFLLVVNVIVAVLRSFWLGLMFG